MVIFDFLFFSSVNPSSFLHLLVRSGSVQNYWNEIYYFVDHLAHKFIRWVQTEARGPGGGRTDGRLVLTPVFCFLQSSAADVFHRLFHRGTDSDAINRRQVAPTPPPTRVSTSFLLAVKIKRLLFLADDSERGFDRDWRSCGWCSPEETPSWTRVSRE